MQFLIIKHTDRKTERMNTPVGNKKWKSAVVQSSKYGATS